MSDIELSRTGILQNKYLRRGAGGVALCAALFGGVKVYTGLQSKSACGESFTISEDGVSSGRQLVAPDGSVATVGYASSDYNGGTPEVAVRIGRARGDVWSDSNAERVMLDKPTHSLEYRMGAKTLLHVDVSKPDDAINVWCGPVPAHYSERQ